MDYRPRRHLPKRRKEQRRVLGRGIAEPLQARVGRRDQTRLFSIPITDTPDHTRAVLAAIGAQAAGQAPVAGIDIVPWHALQIWLESGEHVATVPYAGELAAAIPPIAVRLRRDFGALLGLIQAHAILHQRQRERDAQGRIVATLDDYAAVYSLVADILAAGVEASVPSTIRETVEAVRAELGRPQVIGVPLGSVAERLGIEKSSASRRVASAIKSGYLVNDEERKGRPALLVLGDPLPAESAILPDRAALASALP